MLEKIRKNSDAVVAVIMILFAGFITMLILQIKNTQSRIMPFFAVSLIAGGSLVLMVNTLIRHKSPYSHLLHKKRELIVWGMFVVFFILISYLGFYTSAFLFVTVCFFYLSGGLSKAGFLPKQLLNCALFALIFIVVVYAIFGIGFRIVLPRGILI